MTYPTKIPVVFNYEWVLTDIEEKKMTILSKMIKFNGEESFRAGLKNAATPTLLFMTTNLNKMGMLVTRVLFSSKSKEMDNQRMGIEPNEEYDESGNVQLFTTELESFQTGNQTFFFQIYIEEVVGDYYIMRKDSLLKEQLWSSAVNRLGTDFEFIAEGKIFPVHKFVIAARSPVFADLAGLKDRLPDEKDTPQATALKQKTESVDAASMEQFLKFVYTGELEGSVEKELMTLATTYEIKTLEELCDTASHDIERALMASLALQLGSEKEQIPSKITPDTATEIPFSSTYGVYSFTWDLERAEDAKKKELVQSKTFEYHNIKLFRVEVTTRLSVISTTTTAAATAAATALAASKSLNSELKINLLSFNHQSIGFKIDGVRYSTTIEDNYWIEPKKFDEIPTVDQKLVQLFIREDTFLSSPRSITFEIYTTSTVKNFDHVFTDSTWTEQLWMASMNKQLTDVELVVENKIFHSYRPLLSARSPVFATIFSDRMKEPQKGPIRIDDVSPNTFWHFLQFIYNGTVKPQADLRKLLVLADQYKVETLKNVCLSALEKEGSAEIITRAFLSC